MDKSYIDEIRARYERRSLFKLSKSTENIFETVFDDVNGLLSHIEALEKRNKALEFAIKNGFVQDYEGTAIDISCPLCIKGYCGNDTCDFAFDEPRFTKGADDE